MAKMRATVFHGVNDIRVDEVERPRAGVGEAVIRVTLTTICGTDLHIVRGEYPVKSGLVIGHEPVGVIDELGPAASAVRVCRASSRNAVMVMDMRPWAAGASATRSTARRPSICSCRTRRPISRGFRTS
jgi:NADPH:quinone reductase-like Zn-dependent oxidoreductase